MCPSALKDIGAKLLLEKPDVMTDIASFALNDRILPEEVSLDNAEIPYDDRGVWRQSIRDSLFILHHGSVPAFHVNVEHYTRADSDMLYKAKGYEGAFYSRLHRLRRMKEGRKEEDMRGIVKNYFGEKQRKAVRNAKKRERRKAKKAVEKAKIDENRLTKISEKDRYIRIYVKGMMDRKIPVHDILEDLIRLFGLDEEAAGNYLYFA